MSTVYYQGPAGLTITLAITDEPGEEPTSVPFTEDAETPGLYTAEAEDPENTIASVMLGSVPIDGGTIAEAGDGRLWLMGRALRSSSPPYASHSPARAEGSLLKTFLGEDEVLLPVTCYEPDRLLMSLTGRTLRYSVSPHDDPENPFYTSDTFTGSGTAFDLEVRAAATTAEAINGEAHHWALREGKKVIQRGRLAVETTSVGATT